MAELLAPFGPIPRFNSRTNSQTIVESSFPMPSGRLRGPTRASAHPGRRPSTRPKGPRGGLSRRAAFMPAPMPIPAPQTPSAASPHSCRIVWLAGTRQQAPRSHATLRMHLKGPRVVARDRTAGCRMHLTPLCLGCASRARAVVQNTQTLDDPPESPSFQVPNLEEWTKGNFTWKAVGSSG